LQWSRCLRQIYERHGAIEIAVARAPDETSAGSYLVWRVRLLGLSDTEIHVEPPATLGKSIPLDRGLQLIGVIAVGQNRWTFTTQNLGPVECRTNQGVMNALRLSMPDDVKRCQRRNYYRVETTGMHLPEVELWPLLDPKSVVLAERSNELLFLDRDLNRRTNAQVIASLNSQDIMPEVGPRFAATLINIGGGGVGLRVRPDEAQNVARHKLFWARIGLPPELHSPVCATAKVVHTHMDSSMHTYAGMAFDFSFNPGHQQFVVDQICRYIAMQQQAQLQKKAG
jgi:hypothetical protein